MNEPNKIDEPSKCRKGGKGVSCHTKTEADYHALAAARGLAWTGEISPHDVLTLTTWRCPRGHAFTMRFASVQERAELPDLQRAQAP